MVPEADGLDGEVVDVPPEPLIPAEPLVPVEPLLMPDDAPALPAELPDAPPAAPPPPPPLCANASPALPARRTAAINDIERVLCIANSCEVSLWGNGAGKAKFLEPGEGSDKAQQSVLKVLRYRFAVNHKT